MEFEVKYIFENHRADFVRRLLSARFVPDKNYPVGIITSIYFDSKEMLSYEEKRASTYLKTKIRLRWYLDPDTRQPDAYAFWETKKRVGTQRSKQREPSNLSPEILENIDISDPRLIQEAQQHSLYSGVRLQVFPAVMIRYTRHRFIDSVNGSRINVDSNIYSRKINPSLANERTEVSLPVGVIEYKGEYDRISPVISDIGRLGAKKRAFSKYESVIKWVKSNHRLI